MAPGAEDDAGEAGGAAPLLGDAPDSQQPHTPPPPRWYTPKRLLLLFCAMQFMVYADRGVRALPLRAARVSICGSASAS
jgi:hypothetical protein